MPRQIFHKVSCTGHAVLLDDDGKIIEDMSTEPVTCRTLEELSNFFAKMHADIETFNTSQPNRKQRRAAEKK